MAINPEHTETAPAEPGRRLPFAFAKRHGVLIQDAENDRATAIYRTGASPLSLAEVRRFAGVPVDFVEVDTESFDLRLQAAYESGAAMTMVEGLDGETDLLAVAQQLPEPSDLLDSDDDAPIIRLINALLTQAVKDNASDIHVEPYENRLVVRFRIDGVLKEVLQSKRAVAPLVVSRIKVMSKLDIAEKRLPQDGRISLRIAGRAVDVRVSTIPSGHGERVVLRLLEKDLSKLNLEVLGMAERTRKTFDVLIHQPHGIILVTGPTGSGKTTTLYAAIRRLDHSTTNIMTVEDPIEYDLEGIGQTQVNPKIEMTFSRALRSILRQDPDVVMVGEIRDLETAQIAVQASLTGHLVLATLHTNDSASAVTRLIDMGIEPFLLSSSLLAVLGQRLVRKLCPHCKKPEAGGNGFAPVGCDKCSHTGYIGRTGIYELMQVDEQMRLLVHNGANDTDIRRIAERAGMTLMRADGLRWVLAGVTSHEEVVRVTRE